MSTSLQVAQPVNALPIRSVEDIKTLGAVIAQSNLFGEGVNPAAGVAIAAMCHQDGISYTRWMQNYHLIQGKVSKRADAMLADFQRMGGHYRIERRDADGAVIVFTYDGNEYRSDCTWADIKDEPFTKNKNGSRKDKYSTPRSRMQMLWARAVSDGLRVVCPQCVQGVYTPEEVSDFDAPTTDDSAPVAYAKQRRGRVFSSTSTAPAAVVEAEAVPAAPDAAPSEPKAPELFAPEDDDVQDFGVCPIPGPLLGKRWEDMPTEHLELAMSFGPDKAPQMTDGHRAAIAAIVESRGEQEASDEQ